jgi:hypothetical protein
MRRHTAAFRPDAQNGRVSGKEQPLNLKQLSRAQWSNGWIKAPAGKPAETFFVRVAKQENATVLGTVIFADLRVQIPPRTSFLLLNRAAVKSFCAMHSRH